jgi:protein TonB
MTFGRLLCAGGVTTACGLAQLATAGGAQVTTGPPQALVGAFIQSEPGPLEKLANPITPENPIPRVAFVIEPRYPTEAWWLDARATISLRVTLDDLGRVGEIRTNGVPVLAAIRAGATGDETALALRALIESARRSAGAWLYDPPANPPISFDVAISFSSEGKPEVTLSEGKPQFTLSEAPADRSPRAAMLQLPPLPPELAPSGPEPEWARGVARVGGNFTPPRKIVHVNPVYPDEARQARVQGVVVIEARIEADGRIINARILRSIPVLDQAALDAVTQWVFTPTLQNGSPVSVLMALTVQFSLD